ncbi:hypothetical protein B0A77_14700 [Flavobacterium branchiophilum]|uniref:Uncharacterized protein n=1 Tax=Flavobacterium branchiophilum TaxID=55197 RepID=A0A2H3KIY5_9FLAO|nr:hypothetical protein B0A77_14700 [Flavobacterium branchiophilum]
MQEVEGLFSKETTTIIYLYIAGEVLEVTPEHPFLVNGEWLTADKLTTYHSLTLYDGTTTPIEKIETITLATPKKVYNFAVQGYNSYFVGESKVLVHNCEIKLHKNNNKAKGNFVLYQIDDVDGKPLKIGKADADDIMPTTGEVRRMKTSERLAKKTHPGAKGRIIEGSERSTTTGDMKDFEAKSVRDSRASGNPLPLNKERSKKYKP